MSIRKRYLQAVKEPLNLFIAAGGVVLSIAFGHPLVMLAIVLLEVAYLAVVPSSAWYAQRLRQCEEADIRRQREDTKARVLPTLCAPMQERYKRLETMHRQAYERTREVHRWFTDAPRKFDALLDAFLDFAGKQAVFVQYLSSVNEEVCGVQPVEHKEFNPYRKAATLDPNGPWVSEAISNISARYADETSSLQVKLSQEKDDSAKDLLAKHAEILTHRAEFITELAKTLENLNRQLQLLEDTFALVNEEMLTRKPEEILTEINDVVSQSDAMANVLQDMAASEQILTSLDRLKITS